MKITIRNNPYQQAFIPSAFIIISAIFILALKLITKGDFDPYTIWTVNTSMILFYIIINVILGMTQAPAPNYYRNSIYAFILLLTLSLITGRLISGVNILNAKTYAWICFVFTFVYLLFLSIQELIRKIVQIALKQENKIRNENK